MTALAFRIQHEYNSLVDELSGAEDAEEQAKEQAKSSSKLDVAAHEFVVGELLGVAMSADYGDEIGRRKMFGLVREYRVPSTECPCLSLFSKLRLIERNLVCGNRRDDLPTYASGNAHRALSGRIAEIIGRSARFHAHHRRDRPGFAG